MGAWHFIDRRLEASMQKAKTQASRPNYIGRISAASPATGYMSVHVQEQKAIIDKVLG